MRVVVRFHDSARADYEEWQARLSQPPTGNRVIARIHVEELIRRLQETGGSPAGTMYRRDLDPPSFVWRFSTDTWVQFTLEEQRTGCGARSF